MEKFVSITGVAAPLMRSNIDTDLLIPSREMTSTGKDGCGEKLLAPWRYLASADGVRVENPDFILNQARFRDAVILLAGDNFGSGSSREAAVWALRQFGFRCVIAPSFGAIFQNNCYRNGVLPVVLAPKDVQALAEAAQDGAFLLSVDLVDCAIVQADGARLHFSVPPAERGMLLEGLDAIGMTLKRRDEIETFQRADRLARPWIWQHEREETHPGFKPPGA